MQTKELRILLIDDDEEEYTLTDLFLRDRPAAPYSLGWAKTYQDALWMVQNGSWDVILLDTVEGYELSLVFVQKLKTLTSIPIVMYTGFDFPWYVEKATNAGATAFLSKMQMSAENLWGAIQSAVEGK